MKQEAALKGSAKILESKGNLHRIMNFDHDILTDEMNERRE